MTSSQKRLALRVAAAALVLLGAAVPCAASSWYDTAGILAAGAISSSPANTEESGGKGNPGDGASSTKTSKTETRTKSSREKSAREDAAKLRKTMNAIVREYDKIGAGELARQCIDASRIVQIAENPTGWREILFLLAGLVSLIAALFITKLLGSMFKIEIAQLLWIPLAACIALLIGLFAAIRAAKKRKAAVAAGIALSAVGAVSFIDPLRHAFFSIVAEVFVIFTAWYVPLAAIAIGVVGLLFLYSLLCNHAGGVFASIGSFLLRNVIGIVLIPGVCALLFLGILSVVGPWFDRHANEFASAWEESEQATVSETSAAAVSLEALSAKAAKATKEIEDYSRRIHEAVQESSTTTTTTSESTTSGQGNGGYGGDNASGASQNGGSSSANSGMALFSAFPREVRQSAAEMARAAEGVYYGTLPRGSTPFDGFLSHSSLRPRQGRSWDGSDGPFSKPSPQSFTAHSWDARSGTFSTQSGLVAQVFSRDTGRGGREMVVVFRGTADARDGLENWRQLFGSGYAPQYSEAAALVTAVRETTALPLVVLGHSLGGGQTQYAVAMNQVADELRGVGFNPAGLSSMSIGDIERRRGEGDSVRAARSLAMVRLENDPVSAAGVHLGRIVIVASYGIQGISAHSISTLASAMERAAR